MEMIIAALSLGLVGSFHCVGMCGPIAIALPLDKRSWGRRVTSTLWYNMGRSITYMAMGLVFGLVGKGFSMAGFHNWLSILAGAFMIVSILFPKIYHTLFRGSGDSKLMQKIKTQIAKHFKKANSSSLFIIGLLNGLLPCGMVYMALAGAVATGSPHESAIFMALFGLGTIPIMISMSLAGNLASLKFKSVINKIIPAMIVLIGLLFILRGLELGIKYVSPSPEILEINEGRTDHCGGYDHTKHL